MATTAGEVLFMKEGSGCLVQDLLGPRTQILSQSLSSPDFESNFSSVAGAAFLEVTADISHHVNVNSCGGVAKSETWNLVFDRNLQGWRVSGSISGDQQNIAFEDQRYISDDGSVSFVIRAGVMASEDGWEIQFQVLAGVVSANGDNDGDGQQEVAFEYPSDPVFFHYRVGPSDDPWRPVDDRPFVLVPAEASNLVGRVRPQAGEVEVIWN